MHFDDRLATVLRHRAAGERAAKTQFRQLLDLLGEHPQGWRRPGAQGGGLSPADRVGRHDPDCRTRAIVGENGWRFRNPELVRWFGEAHPAIAAAALQRAISRARNGPDHSHAADPDARLPAASPRPAIGRPCACSTGWVYPTARCRCRIPWLRKSPEHCPRKPRGPRTPALACMVPRPSRCVRRRRRARTPRRPRPKRPGPTSLALALREGRRSPPNLPCLSACDPVPAPAAQDRQVRRDSRAGRTDRNLSQGACAAHRPGRCADPADGSSSSRLPANRSILRTTNSRG